MPLFYVKQFLSFRLPAEIKAGLSRNRHAILSKKEAIMEPFRAQIPNHFSLPRRINRLGELAYNLWWTWNPDSQRLFSRIDKELWESTYHNPLASGIDICRLLHGELPRRG